MIVFIIFYLLPISFIASFIILMLKRKDRVFPDYIARVGKDKHFKIYIIDEMSRAAAACKLLEKEIALAPVLGFDAEWVMLNKIVQPTALVQLCTFNGTCLLFRLCRLKKIPDCLAKFLQSESIIKTGVAPLNDASLLYQHYGVHVRGTLDLRFLIPTIGGLAILSEDVLGIKLNKNLAIRCGDWEAQVLTNIQIYYAAKDAYVAIEIFKKWATPEHIKYKWVDVEADVSSFLDQQFKIKRTGKTEKIIKPSKMPTIKRDIIYDNCLLQAPDGGILSTVSRSKVDWYLKYEIADIVCDNPLTIRLRFEPKKRSSAIDDYNKELKRDICVVCGATKGLVRQYIVPRMFFKHFPLEFKSHCSHDILLMCLLCHFKFSNIAEVVKTRLKEEAGVSVMSRDNCKVRSLAKALIKQADSIPAKRKREMEEIIKQHSNISGELTTEDLNAIMQDEPFETFQTGKQIVDYYIENRSIFDLQRLWRQTFVDHMKPQFLSKRWSIDHVN